MGTKLTVQSKLNANEKCGLDLGLTDRLNMIIAVNWEGKQQTPKSNPHLIVFKLPFPTGRG